MTATVTKFDVYEQCDPDDTRFYCICPRVDYAFAVWNMRMDVKPADRARFFIPAGRDGTTELAVGWSDDYAELCKLASEGR